MTRAWVWVVLVALVGCDDDEDGASGDATPDTTTEQQPDGAVAGGCSDDDDCGEGLVCLSEHCVLPQCTVDEECNPGLVCEGYRCVFHPVEAGLDAGPMEDAAPDMAPADGPLAPPDMAPDVEPDAAAGCADDDDCAADEVCDIDSQACLPRIGCPEACEDGFVCDEGEGRCVAEVPEPCGGDCDDGFECDEEADECVRAECEDDALGGNDAADAALVEAGLHIDLVTCTATDWFAVEIPAGGAGLEVTVRFDGDNLDVALFPDDGALGLPIAEAATDAQPETLRANRLDAGRYLLRVSSWSLEPPAPVVRYELDVVVEPDGFCDDDDDCGAGRLCEDNQCVAGGGCAERCPPLSVCDPVESVCVPSCEPDAYLGVNESRETAAIIEPGVLDDLTVCDSEEDWFEIDADIGATIVVHAVGEAIGDGDDLDIELWGQPPAMPDPEFDEEAVARSAFVGERDERLEHRVEAPGPYYVRVFSARRTLYRLRVDVGESCLFDWDCCPMDDPDCPRRCDGVRSVCVDVSCAADPPDFDCDDGEVCDQVTGRCGPPVCDPDVYGGDNGRLEDAALVESGDRIDALTVCDGDEDWYRVVTQAGDGVRVAIRFEDARGGLDLELYDEQRLLNGGHSVSDDETLEYNVDDAGPKYIRVQGADRAWYDLEVDVVAGGIDPLLCGETLPCGFARFCNNEQVQVCVARTCAGPNPNLMCGAGFACHQPSGSCRCENGDEFLEQNIDGESAVRLDAGAYEALTICGEEEDWFRVALLAGETLNVEVVGDGGDEPLGLNLFDDELAFIATGDAAPGGATLSYEAAADGVVFVVVSNGPPRGPAAYDMTIEVE